MLPQLVRGLGNGPPHGAEPRERVSAGGRGLQRAVDLVGRWGPVGASWAPCGRASPLTGTPCTKWATHSSASSAPTSSFGWCGPAEPSPRTPCSSGSPWSESAGTGPWKTLQAAPRGSASADGGLASPLHLGKLGASRGGGGFSPAPPAQSSHCSSPEARPGPRSSSCRRLLRASRPHSCRVCLSQGWAQAWLELPWEPAGAGEAGARVSDAFRRKGNRASPSKDGRGGAAAADGATPRLDAGPAGLPAARGHSQTATSLGSVPLSEATGPLVGVGKWD